MSANSMRLRLGNMLVEVPIHRDEETTLGLVERVNQRLREIEQQSPVIDSQRFALLAAYAFAQEALELEDEVAEMAAAFEELDGELSEILGELGS
jgi:cell division protein ZapA (FtsZ GTPase activity inhibitor)